MYVHSTLYVQCRAVCAVAGGTGTMALLRGEWLQLPGVSSLVPRSPLGGQQKAAYSWPVCSMFPALGFENRPCLRGEAKTLGLTWWPDWAD